MDGKIRDTYAAYSKATNKNALYDSYIRAIRWASDRVGDSGVVGFVTNAGFIEANTADGLRKCLAEEFSSVYIFHLRGNARTSGEIRRKEKDNVFGQGTRTPIAITLFVKNPQASESGKIFIHDIGDYLSQSDKLERISDFGSLNGITAVDAWKIITPDAHNDWLGQRDDSFDEFIGLGDKKDKTATVLFEKYSMGIKTNRDAWVYQFSQKKLQHTITQMINFFNFESLRYKAAEAPQVLVENFINTDPSKISWSRALRADIRKFITRQYRPSTMTIGMYRPFTKNHLYFDRYFINDIALMPTLFPEISLENRVICVTGRGSTKEFCALITNTLPDLEMVSKGQCFPLKIYDFTTPPETNQHSTGLKPQGDLFSDQATGLSSDMFEQAANIPSYDSRDGMTDEGLSHYQTAYPNETFNKEDLFYYIYGLLHSEDYKNRYADNLKKELPRIPAVKKAADFWAFSKSGRELAELHINYETQPKNPVKLDCGKRSFDALTDADFYVTKMKFAKKGDKSVVVYNHAITLRDIPLEAYEYVVNGKPALEWVMERQGVTTHKASGIVNDANDWATETMKNARYPLDLFQRVITVSLRTVEIVKGLPKLDI